MLNSGVEPDELAYLPFEYLDYAEQFFEAFEQLPEERPGGPPSWPRYFLLCHSIELALKAYLALRGSTPGQLRQSERRHNLDQLVNEAVEKGLALPPLAQERIELLHKAHKKYWHRYPPDDGVFKVYVLSSSPPLLVNSSTRRATKFVGRDQSSKLGAEVSTDGLLRLVARHRRKMGAPLS